MFSMCSIADEMAAAYDTEELARDSDRQVNKFKIRCIYCLYNPSSKADIDSESIYLN